MSFCLNERQVLIDHMFTEHLMLPLREHENLIQGRGYHCIVYNFTKFGLFYIYIYESSFNIFDHTNTFSEKTVNKTFYTIFSVKEYVDNLVKNINLDYITG